MKWMFTYFGGALFGRFNFAAGAVILTALLGLAIVFVVAGALKWLVDNGLWFHFIIGAGLLLAWYGRRR